VNYEQLILKLNLLIFLVVYWDKLMNISKDYWLNDIEETLKWLDEQLGEDLPQDICGQIEQEKQSLIELN
jgi:GTP-dependent phosphoenolpyruvate carboxykinase